MKSWKTTIVAGAIAAILMTAPGCASTPQETNSRLDHLSAGVTSLVDVVNEFAAASENDQLREIATKVDAVGGIVTTGIADVKSSITAEGTIDPGKASEIASGLGSLVFPGFGEIAGLLGASAAVFFNQRQRKATTALKETVKGVEAFKTNGSDSEAKKALMNNLGSAQSASTKLTVAKLRAG